MSSSSPAGQPQVCTAHIQSAIASYVSSRQQNQGPNTPQVLNLRYGDLMVQQQPEIPLRLGGELPLFIRLEPPLYGNRKPRICWTGDLHARFIRAVMQLGGLFKATPKNVLELMNVRGMTVDHVKSHLQKVRNKYPNDII